MLQSTDIVLHRIEAFIPMALVGSEACQEQEQATRGLPQSLKTHLMSGRGRNSAAYPFLMAFRLSRSPLGTA